MLTAVMRHIHRIAAVSCKPADHKRRLYALQALQCFATIDAGGCAFDNAQRDNNNMARLDSDALDYLMRERGLDTYTEVARKAGIHPLTLLKARHGGNCRLKTILAVENALAELPAVIPGSRLVGKS